MNKRIFITDIESDAFLELPISTQFLYLHLIIRADSNGFVLNHKSIMRMIESNESDMGRLIYNGYVQKPLTGPGLRVIPIYGDSESVYCQFDLDDNGVIE